MKKTLLLILLTFTNISFANILDKQIASDAEGGVWIYDDWNGLIKYCELEYKDGSEISCTNWEQIENDSELAS